MPEVIRDPNLKPPFEVEFPDGPEISARVSDRQARRYETGQISAAEAGYTENGHRPAEAPKVKAGQISVTRLSVSNKRRRDDGRDMKPSPSGTADPTVFNGPRANYEEPGPYSEATEDSIQEFLDGRKTRAEVTTEKMEEFEKSLQEPL